MATSGNIQTSGDVTQLLDPCGPCISIYCPVPHAASEHDAARLQAKNLIHDAEKELSARGMRSPKARELVAPLKDLTDNLVARTDGVQAVAAFAAPDRSLRQELPYACAPLTRIGPRFHLTPLMPWLGENRHFELLLLAQKQVRFYRGDRVKLEPVDVPNLPASLQDALGGEVTEQSLQFHTGAAAAGGPRSRMVHGQGAGDGEDRKSDIQRFCHAVDDALASHRPDPQLPLIVAAVDYVFHIFQSVTRIRTLTDDFIRGNCDHFSTKQLHEQAARIIAQQVEAQRDRDRELLPEAMAHERGSQDIREVLIAAADGRVDTLFAALDDAAWGRLTPDRQVQLDDGPTGDNEDLINQTAINTYACRGRIHVLDRGDMPVESPLAAIYRY